MSSLIAHKPPGHGAMYENAENIPLVDAEGNETGYHLGATRHTPRPPNACCMPDGSCSGLNPICCREVGGAPLPAGTECLGDLDGDGTDDACEEDCGNGEDDDGDGLVDCDDVDECISTDDDKDGHYTPGSCREPRDDCADDDESIPGPEDNAEACHDGKDNDCDERVDCDDEECAEDPLCREPPTENCTNGEDDDGDGRADCDDEDCADDSACQRPIEDCDNGEDDDGDGNADCQDADCAGAPACVTIPPIPCGPVGSCGAGTLGMLLFMLLGLLWVKGDIRRSRER